MKRALVVAGLALLLAAPLVAQDEGHRHFRYQVEAPHGNWSHMGREFGRMGRDWGRMGREYSRMGRDYARMYSRDWGRQWRGQEFGRQFRNFSGDMHRNWGRQWGRMGPNFQWRGYGPTPRRGEI